MVLFSMPFQDHCTGKQESSFLSALQVVKGLGLRVHGKNFWAPGLQGPPFETLISVSFQTDYL